MSVLAEPEFVAETLAWCNERRGEDGKPPLDSLPKGRREDGASCPCGKATGLHVGIASYSSAEDRRTLKYSDWTLLPEAVSQFVRRFDMGELPQYDAAVKP